MDLFNNPMTQSALKAMTPKQIEEYRKVGEHMFGDVDFTDSTLINRMIPPTNEAVAYIEEGIKSGLLPKDLEENEVELLTQTFGNKWYLKYGFKENEVPESGLGLHMKKHMEKAVKAKLEQLKLEKKKLG